MYGFMYCKKNRCLLLPDKCVKRRTLVDNMNVPINNRDVCRECTQAKEIDKYFESKTTKPYVCPEISKDLLLQARASELSTLMNKKFDLKDIQIKERVKNLFAMTYHDVNLLEAA